MSMNVFGGARISQYVNRRLKYHNIKKNFFKKYIQKNGI